MVGVIPITERTVPTLDDSPMTYMEEYAPVWVCEVLDLCDQLAATATPA